MSPVFAARRRAEEFASLVEDASTGTADAARYAKLLELVGALRTTPPVEPRPAFVADLRERLMTAAATELVPAPASPVQDRLTLPRRSPRERRLAVAVGGFAIIGATTSMAVAAQSALPGDALYPLKRAIENAHTGLSVDDEQKGSTLLANATGRLEEVDRLTRAADAEELDVQAIEETLETFTEQATEASDLMIAAYAADGDDAAIAALQDFTTQSFQSLNELAAEANDQVRDALVPVGNALAAIEAAIQKACPACASVTSIPQWMTMVGAQQPGSTLGELLGTTAEVDTAAEPTKPSTGKGKGDGKGDGKDTGKPRTEDQPSGEDDPVVEVPGDPTSTTGDGSGSGTDPGSNAVEDLVGGLLGDGSTTTEQPEIPIVGPVVEGLGDVVDGLTSPVKKP